MPNPLTLATLASPGRTDRPQRLTADIEGLRGCIVHMTSRCIPHGC